MKKVAAVIRVSTEDQAREERGGIPGQKLRIQTTVERFSLTIVRTFEIIDVSGTKIWHSPIFQDFLEFIKSDEIQGVVVADESRLLRPGKKEDLKLLDYLSAADVTIFTSDGALDPGSLTAAFKYLMAGEDRKKILAQMNAAKEAKRRLGKHVGGGIAYGVVFDRKTFTWSPMADKVPEVRKVFKLFLAGVTYERIASLMKLARTTVQYILQNPIYTGVWVIDKKRDPSPGAEVCGEGGRQGYRRKMMRSPQEIVRVRVMAEGIISQSDFDAAQILIFTKKANNRRARTGVYTAFSTYRGFLRCGDPECGCPLYTSASQTSLFYSCKSHNSREAKKRDAAGLTRCSNKYMLRKHLEAKLDKLFGHKFVQASFLNHLVMDSKRKIERISKTFSVVTTLRAIERLTSKRERVLETYYDGKISKQERDDKLLYLDQEIITRRQFSEEAQTCMTARSILDVPTLQAAFAPLLGWCEMPTADRRRILASLSPEIIVYQGEVNEVRFPLIALLKSSRSEMNGYSLAKLSIPIHPIESD